MKKFIIKTVNIMAGSSKQAMVNAVTMILTIIALPAGIGVIRYAITHPNIITEGQDGIIAAVLITTTGSAYAIAIFREWFMAALSGLTFQG
ncbi:MAG: hypothetical protein GY874_04805 [Desulfobacteraceae bacterium]|nr:hypothetical protein [Desulfobacteraceae bacterium]